MKSITKKSIKKQLSEEFLERRFNLLQLAGTMFLIAGLLMIGLAIFKNMNDIAVQILTPYEWYISSSIMTIGGIFLLSIEKKEKEAKD